ncbi:MAG: hypothetical protein AAB456_00750 [Patescibacteria group bacterium]
MIKRKIIFNLIIVSAISYLLFAVPVSAAPVSVEGLVPCGTTANPKMCTVCDFFVLIQRIIKLIILISASLATLAAIYIAFLFMFSGGSPAKITDAKGKLWLVVVGIFWVLGSWLVLNTILSVVADPTKIPWPWYKIDCAVSKSKPPSPPPTSEPVIKPDIPTQERTPANRQTDTFRVEK